MRNVHITKSNLRVYCTSCLSKPYPDSRHPYGSGERDFPSVELTASKPCFVSRRIQRTFQPQSYCMDYIKCLSHYYSQSPAIPAPYPKQTLAPALLSQ